MPRYYVHVTHRNNLESIAREGLDPARSQGELPLVWCCEHYQIAWAWGHVQQRHGWDAADLVVLRCDMQGIPLRGRTRRGVHTTPLVVSPRRITVISAGESIVLSPVTAFA